MNKNIVEIENSQITEEYKNIQALNMFYESQSKQQPLLMRVDGCQPNPNASSPELKWMAIGYMNGWKVVIPASLMGFEDIDNDKEMSKDNKERAYKSYITQMIGAEIEFIVHPHESSISESLKMVIGNRVAALEKRKASNYFKKDKNNESRMERAFKAGKPVQARVVTVARSVVFVEIFGHIAQVFAREVSWRYVSKLQNVVNVGDVVLVKFLDLQVDKENKAITSEVSIKAAYPNVMKENMKKYQPGAILRGVITGAKGGYFVQVGSVQSGIDVYCKKVNCPEEPKLGDTVLVNLYVFDYDEGRVFGSIERIIERKDHWVAA